jgi:hypothetical protein
MDKVIDQIDDKDLFGSVWLNTWTKLQINKVKNFFEIFTKSKIYLILSYKVMGQIDSLLYYIL